ncbi:MAG: hypothetical protein ACRC1T_11985 [Clostridium chrysemydis]
MCKNNEKLENELNLLIKKVDELEKMVELLKGEMNVLWKGPIKNR